MLQGSAQGIVRLSGIAAKVHTGNNQCAGLVGMQFQQLAFAGVHGLVMLIQFLAIQHTACPGCFGQVSRRLHPALGVGRRVGNSFKGCCNQGICRQQGGCFAILLMAAQAAAAVIIIIHAGHVIVNQGIAVQHFQRRGIVGCSCGIAARQLAGSQHQHGAHTLAAAQQAVTRCLADLGFYRQINIAQFVQALLRLLHKGFILLLITFLFHGEKPPYPAGSLIRAGLCQRCVDLFDL